MSNIPNWLWLAIAAAGGYVAYEWLQSQCETSGSTFYGGSLCVDLFPAAAASAATTAASPATAPATTDVQNAAILAAYGLPSDSEPANIYPSGQSCDVVQPIESGYNPTPGAPFYSASDSEYVCGPANLWQSMMLPAQSIPVVASVPMAATPAATSVSSATTGQTSETSQWNAGPQHTFRMGPRVPLVIVAPVIPQTTGGSQPGMQGINRIPVQFIHRSAA